MPGNLEFRCVDVLRREGEGTVRMEMSQPIGIPTAWHGTFDVVFESQTRVHIPDAVRARPRNLKACLKTETGVFATHMTTTRRLLWSGGVQRGC